MRGAWMYCGMCRWTYRALAPLALAAGLAACSAGVQPGIISTSPAPQSASAGPYNNGQGQQTYVPNNGYGNGGGYNTAGYNGGGYNGNGGGYTPVSASAGDGGRVVSINEVSLGGGGVNGTTVGSILGGLGGVAIGVGTGGGWAGGLLGGLLGVMGGAMAGSVYDQHRGSSGRGIEVTVQRDDGSTVKVAQRDDGDIQLGDRVQIVQGHNGVARAMRDNSHTNDNPPAQYSPPTQSQYTPPGQYGSGQYGSGQYGSGQYGSGQYGPGGQYGSQQYSPPTQSQYSPPGQYGDQQQYNPQPQDNRQSQYNPPSQDYGSPQGQGQGPVYPQNNPRYGTLQ